MTAADNLADDSLPTRAPFAAQVVTHEVRKDILHGVEVLGGAVLFIDGARRVTLEGMGMALVGLGLLQRGISGIRAQHAPLESVQAGRHTAEKSIHWEYVDKSVVIGRPVEAVYHAWHDVENLPFYMPHLKTVQLTGVSRSHWVARAPAGLSVEWESEITREVPNSLLSWRTLPGSDIPNQGTVRFEPMPDNCTRLRLSLRYGPPVGKLGVFVARLLGKEPGQFIEADLYRFKHMLERGDERQASAAPPRPAPASPEQRAS
jgi:uncharacterized membrane protein